MTLCQNVLFYVGIPTTGFALVIADILSVMSLKAGHCYKLLLNLS